MKLAGALILRADIQKNIAQLRERLPLNAKVQEGDSPAENPEEFMDTLAVRTAAFIELVQRINRTNAAPLAGAVVLPIFWRSATPLPHRQKFCVNFSRRQPPRQIAIPPMKKPSAAPSMLRQNKKNAICSQSAYVNSTHGFRA